MPSGLTGARPSRVRTLLVMGVTAVVILAVSYLANRPAAGGGGFTSVVLSGRPSGPPPETGKPAPDFSATTIKGQKVTLTDMRGHPFWLTFGATWCQECRVENPDIQAAWEKYRGQGLKLLSIWIQDDRSTIIDYSKRIGLTYPKVDDADSRMESAYRIVGIPSHFFIDGKGILREIRISGLEPEAMDENLAEIGVDVDRPTE